MKYEEMSDFEINKYVADTLGVFWHVKTSGRGKVCFVYSENYERCDTTSGQIAINLPDYCNNPSDAWPIIIQNRINVYASEGPDFMPWIAGCGGVMISHKNPLRAAMIVFLMMKDAQNV